MPNPHDWWSEAIGRALRAPDRAAFLAWMQEEGARSAAAVFGLPADEAALRRLATLLGLQLWHTVPRPAEQFRPEPLPRYERNDRCPCGSGAKYKRCCGVAGPPLPAIGLRDLWTAVVDRLEPAEVAALAASGALPPPLLTDIAADLLALAGPEPTLALLTPFLTTPGALDARHEEVAGPFAEAILSLPHRADRSAWVARLRRELPAPLAAPFDLELAGHALAAGDLGAAREAFARADDGLTTNPHAAVIAVRLLTAEGRLDEARERAAGAVAALRRRGYPPDEPPRTFFQKAAEDPQAAIALFSNAAEPEQIEALAALLPRLTGRELPAYGLMEESPSRPDAHLVTPEPLLTLEAAWERVWPLGRPPGTSLRADDDEDAWVDVAASRWLDFLAAHPEAGDSLRILDDLARGVAALEEAGSSWFDTHLLTPLTDRAEAIVAPVLAAAPGATLPWGEPENRPARRLLVDRAYRLHRQGARREAAAALDRLLALDPEDGQELRGDLVTWWLALDEGEPLDELLARLPDDELPEVVWGRVLAQLRRQRPEAAEAAIARALAVRPHVAGYLLAEDPEPPADTPSGELDPEHERDYISWEDDEGVGLAEGSPLEAWFYAREARPLWAATPGALPWLAARAGSPPD